MEREGGREEEREAEVEINNNKKKKATFVRLLSHSTPSFSQELLAKICRSCFTHL